MLTSSEGKSAALLDIAGGKMSRKGGRMELLLLNASEKVREHTEQILNTRDQVAVPLLGQTPVWADRVAQYQQRIPRSGHAFHLQECEEVRKPTSLFGPLKEWIDGLVRWFVSHESRM